jgi:uncharacterized protein (TIGR00645 family)
MAAQIEPERVIHPTEPALSGRRAEPTERRGWRIARFIERVVLASRWLLAPLYAGLALLLLLLVGAFFIELAHLAEGILGGNASHVTLSALTMLDLVLVASLVVMVMLSGFDNFVARIDLGDDRDELARLTRLGTGSLKVKIVSSAAVISAIYVLEALFTNDGLQQDKLVWTVALHVTLVATAISFAVLDRLETH